jgi:hypothetical protein
MLPFRIELPPAERKSITLKESSQHNNFTFYIHLGPDDVEEMRRELLIKIVRLAHAPGLARVHNTISA